MKNAFFLPIAACAVLFAATGCETESAGEATVSVTPSYATLDVGQSVTLTASGGWSYRWGLSDTAAGSLDKYEGNQVQYTMRSASGIQTVTVTGMSSNSDSTYQAKVTIVPKEGAKTASGGGSYSTSGQGAQKEQSEPASESGTGISVTPSTQVVSSGKSVTLTASGGKDYKWKLSNSSIGTLDKTEGAQVKYTPSAKDGTQKITVTGTPNKSGTSSTATATITHGFNPDDVI